MYIVLLIFFLLIAIGLITLILLQQGKGVDASTSFGVGASTTLFGSNGSSNFIIRMTVILAMLLFIISLVLGNMSTKQQYKGHKWENLDQPVNNQQVDKLLKPNNDIPQ
ncbi:preprotein translocase subunit SecG [Candidatus Fukatsuia anoeciicola]|uniref:preprotein translocase subunit SecG n=1 Tax=Candidatus Fukatsuia anoeciicola TaxID=2994492 RepID=UPI0034643FE4